jgi:hypothetical protein
MSVFRVLEAVDAEDAGRVVAAVSAAVGRLAHPEQLAASRRRIVQLAKLEIQINSTLFDCVLCVKNFKHKLKYQMSSIWKDSFFCRDSVF